MKCHQLKRTVSGSSLSMCLICLRRKTLTYDREEDIFFLTLTSKHPFWWWYRAVCHCGWPESDASPASGTCPPQSPWESETFGDDSQACHDGLTPHLVRDGDRGQVHDLPELEGRGPAAHHRDVLREHTQRVARQRLQPWPRVLKSQEQISAQHESHQILRFSAGKYYKQ